jgi:hypothetical protein
MTEDTGSSTGKAYVIFLITHMVGWSILCLVGGVLLIRHMEEALHAEHDSLHYAELLLALIPAFVLAVITSAMHLWVWNFKSR